MPKRPDRWTGVLKNPDQAGRQRLEKRRTNPKTNHRNPINEKALCRMGSIMGRRTDPNSGVKEESTTWTNEAESQARDGHVCILVNLDQESRHVCPTVSGNHSP